MDSVKLVGGNALAGDLFNKDASLFIAHVCNVRGLWGAGISGQIGSLFPLAHHSYLNYIKLNGVAALGTNNIVTVLDSRKARPITIVNMIAQVEVNRNATRPLVDYDKLSSCLVSLRQTMRVARGCTELHMPKIGSGLAHGDWDVIWAMINTAFAGAEEDGISVYVFDWKIPVTNAQ